MDDSKSDDLAAIVWILPDGSVLLILADDLALFERKSARLFAQYAISSSLIKRIK